MSLSKRGQRASLGRRKSSPRRRRCLLRRKGFPRRGNVSIGKPKDWNVEFLVRLSEALFT